MKKKAKPKIMMSKKYRERRDKVIKDRKTRAEKIAMKGKTPLDKLPLVKRAYVAARASGDSVAAAARAVDIAPNTGRRYEEDPDVQKAYQSLIQQILPASRIVELIKGGTEATIDTYDATGENLIRSDPDWRTRRPFIEMAAEHGGYFTRKTEASGGNIFNVMVQHVGQSPKEEPKVIDAVR